MINTNQTERNLDEIIQGFELYPDRESGYIETPDQVYFDIENPGQFIRDGFNVDRAFGESGARDYRGGYLEDNIYNQKYSASLALSGGTLPDQNRDEMYAGSLLALSERETQLLEYYAGRSKWNLARIGEYFDNEEATAGEDMWDLPGFRLLNEDPDSIFQKKDREFDGIDALNVLKEKNPMMYEFYLKGTYLRTGEILGNPEDYLRDLVRDTNNAAHFFYVLADDYQASSLNRALGTWSQSTTNMDAVYRYIKTFIVDGMLNDPDLEISAEISAALAGAGATIGLVGGIAGSAVGGAVGTGAGGVVTLAVGGLKFTVNSVKFYKRIKKLQLLLKKAQRYLPENIGPYLLTRGKDLSKMGKAKRIGYYTAGNALEGAITGGLAELGNIYRKNSIGDQDWSLGEYATNVALEAGLSPLINPAMGGVFYAAGGLGYGAGQVGNFFLDVTTRNRLSKESFAPLRNFIDNKFEFLDPEKGLAKIEAMETIAAITSDVRDLIIDGEDADLSAGSVGDPDDATNPEGLLTLLLSSLFNEMDLDQSQFMTAVKEITEDLKAQLDNPSDARTQVDLEVLMSELSREMVERNRDAVMSDKGDKKEIGEALNRILVMQQQFFRINKKAREEGLSYKEYLDKIIAEERQFELLDDSVQAAVRAEMDKDVEKGEESKFEKASLEEKLAIAEKISTQTVKEMRDIVGNIEDGTTSLEEAADEATETVDDLTPPEDDDALPDAGDLIPDPPETPEPPRITEGEGTPPGTREKRQDVISRRKQAEEKAHEARIRLRQIIQRLVERRREGKLSGKEKKKTGEQINTAEAALRKLNKLSKEVEQELTSFLTARGLAREDLTVLRETLVDLENQIESLTEILLTDFTDKAQGRIMGITNIKKLRMGSRDITNAFIKLMLTEAGEAESSKIQDALAKGKENPFGSKKINVKNFDEATIESIREMADAIGDEPPAELKTTKEFIDRMIREIDDVTTDKKNKQPTINYSQIQNLFNSKLEVFVNKNTEKLKKTAAWSRREETVLEQEKAFKLYRSAMSNIYREDSLQKAIELQSIRLQQTGAAMQKRQKRLLDAGKTIFETMFKDLQEKEKTTRERQKITVEEIAKNLHPYSEWRQSKIEAAEKDPSVFKEELTLEEARSIFDSETESSENKIKQLTVGKIERVRTVGRFKYTQGKYEHQYKDDDILGTSYDPAYILERSNYGEELGLEYSVLSPEEQGKEFERLDKVAKDNGFETYQHAVAAYNLYVVEAYEVETWDNRVTGIDDGQIVAAKEARIKLTPEEKIRRKESSAKTRKDESVKRRGADKLKATLPPITTKPVVFTRNLDEDIKAWAEFEANIIQIASHENSGGTIPAWRLASAMPEYFRWKLGLSAPVVFGHANILGTQHSALLPSPAVEVEKASVSQLQANEAVLQYNATKVLEIIRAWKIRGLAQVEGWEKARVGEVVDALVVESRKEGDPNSAANLIQTVQFVEKFQSKHSELNVILFNERQKEDGGYILAVDPDTGYPVQFTSNVGLWEDKVNQAIAERILTLEKDRDYLSLTNIAKRFNIQLDFNDPYVSINSVLTEAIRTRLHEIDDTFKLRDFGNGILDYASSETVGYGLVDFLSNKEMPGVQPIQSVLDEDGSVVPVDADESMMEGGAPSNIRLPQEGSLNAAMPLPLKQLGRMISNFRARERMKFILQKDSFTPEEIKAYEEWKKANWKDIVKDSNPEMTGEQVPQFIIPQLVGNTLNHAVMKREEAKRIILELLLDVPRIAAGYIHDQITTKQGFPLMFREGPGTVNTYKYWDGEKVAEKSQSDLPVDGSGLVLPIHHGDHILVPFGRIGEIMAIEQMGPTFEGMTKDAVKRVLEHKAARDAETDWSIDQAIDPRNWSDRNASGEAQMKILSLLADPEAKAKVRIEGVEKTISANSLMKNILNRVFKDSGDGTIRKKENDFYVNSGVNIAEKIYKSNPESDLGKVFKIIIDLNIKNAKDFSDRINDPEISEEQKKKLNTVREIFKIPLMRRMYGGGKPTYALEFENKQGKGYQALREALGKEPSKETLGLFKKELFSQVAGSHEVLIDLALGMDEETKQLAISYLSIEQNADLSYYRRWRDILNLDKTQIVSALSSQETRLELLDAQLRQLAKYDNVDPTDTKEYKKWRNKYGIDKRMKLAEELMTEAVERGEPIHPGSEVDKEIQKILTRDPDNKLAAETIGYLRAVNILNSQEYRINKERMQLVAEGLGFTDFDIDDFLGFENHALYQLMLPTASSGRTYSSRSGSGMDPMGISLERVARVEPYTKDGITHDSFFEYVKYRKDQTEKLGEYTQEMFRDDLQDYLSLDKDNADAMGMYDLEDPSLRKFENRKDAEAELERLMVKQEMLFWSSYDKPPKDVFPGYTAEDSEDSFLFNMINQWHNHSERRHKTLKEEMEFEEMLFANGGVSNPILKQRNKAFGLVNKSVVEASQGEFTYAPYINREHNDSNVAVATSGARGPLAMRPLYKSHSFNNLGLVTLQRQKLQEELNNSLGPLYVMGQAKELSKEEAMVGGEAIGHHPSWKNEDLPSVVPTVFSTFDLDLTTPEGMKAAKLFREIHTWAGERDLEEHLDADPENYARFYLIMEIEKVRKNKLKMSDRKLKTNSDITQRRNAWLTDLHSIVSYTRDIKNPEARRGFQLASKGEPLSIANPVDEEAILQDLLQDVADENNPQGTLLRESLLHEALDFGTAPTENLLLRDGLTLVDEAGNDISDALEMKGLAPRAWAIQNTDFNIFLAATIFTEAIGKTLETFEEGKYKELVLHPEKWEEIEGDDRDRIIDAAFKFARKHRSFVLNVGLEEKVYDAATKGDKELLTYRATIRTQQSVTDDPGRNISESTPTMQRNAWGGIGFGTQLMAKNKIKSKSATLTISSERSTMLLNYLENAMVNQQLTLSNWLNKGMGVKIVDGKFVRNMPLQERIEKATGFSARGIRDAHISSSESLLRLQPNLRTVTDASVSVEGRRVEVVDLDMYWNDANYDGNSSGMAWINSYASPILKVLRDLKESTATSSSKLRAELRLLLQNGRSGKKSNKLDQLTMMLVAMGLENPRVNLMTNRNIRQFINFESYTFGQFQERAEIAQDIVNRIAYQYSEEGYARDNYFYVYARNFFFDEKFKEEGSFSKFQEGMLSNDSIMKNWWPSSPDSNIEQEMKDAYFQAYNHFIEEASDISAEEIRDAESNLDDTAVEAINQLAFIDTPKEGENWLPVGKDLMPFGDPIGLDMSYDGWVKTQGREGIELFDVLRDIDRLLEKGIINKTQRYVMKTMVTKAYTLNSAIVRNLKINSIGPVRGGAEAERAGKNFTIRIGDDIKNLINDDVSIIKIFAHELSHIARLKFIADNGSDYRKFVSLQNSEAGKSMLRKLIKEWHNGIWSKEAKEEYDRYMENPEEFIAGFTSYFIMGESRTVLMSDKLSKDEYKIYSVVLGVVKKVLQNFHRLFGKFEAAFITGDATLDQEVRGILERTFGYDRKKVNKVLEPLSSSEISDAKFGYDYRFGETETMRDSRDMDESLDSMDKKLEMYTRAVEEERGFGDLSAEEVKLKQAELTQLIEAPGTYGGQDYGMAGLSRIQYRRNIRKLQEKYAPDKPRNLEKEARPRSTGPSEKETGIIDLEKLLNDPSATDEDKATAFVYFNKALVETFGDPVSAGLGEVANKTAGVLGLGSEAVRNVAIRGMVGGTEENKTWNSKFLLPILLTQLLDDNIVNAAGNFTNLRGTPSVQRKITEIATFTTNLKQSSKKIDQIISPIVTAITDGAIDIPLLSKGKAIEIKREIQKQIIRVIADPDPFTIKVDDIPGLKGKLNEKQQKELQREMTEIVAVYNKMTEKYVEDGEILGRFGSGFQNNIAYYLKDMTAKNIDERISFREEFKKAIIKHLEFEMGTQGNIHPVVAVQAGLLPSFEDTQTTINDFKKIKNFSDKYYKELLKTLIDPTNKMTTEEKSTELSKLEIAIKGNNIEEVDRILGPNKITAIRLMTTGRINLNTMLRNDDTRSITLINEISKKLVDTITSKVDSKRMTAKKLNFFKSDEMPSSIHFNPNNVIRPERDLKEGFDAIDLILDNFLNRAEVGTYYPNDNFAIPPVHKIIDNEAISNNIVTDLTILAENAKRGLLDEIAEVKLMREFGVHGTFKDVVKLANRAVELSSYQMLDPQGNKLTENDHKKIRDSLTTLTEKHEAILGLDRGKPIHNQIIPYTAAMTKIAYGGNLLLANLTYETSFNALDELLGRGSVAGFLRGALSPILSITNKKERATALADLAYLVESISSGYLPEYELPASYNNKPRGLQFLNTIGNTSMRAAKWQLKNVAAARAISARSAIQGLLDVNKKGESRLIKLAQYLEDNPPKNKRDLKEAMREAGISYYANSTLVMYLLKAGLLDKAKLTELISMMPRNGRYSPFEMANDLFRRSASLGGSDYIDRRPIHPEHGKKMSLEEGEFDRKLEIISALRSVEARFVEEVILAPNAFDDTTGDVGFLDAFFNIYRRYQTLFASQQIIRRSSQFSIRRASFRIVTSLLLDSLYMTLLAVAAGARFEDIEEDYKKNPGTAAVKLMSRTALFGRWWSLITPTLAELFNVVVNEKKMNPYRAFDLNPRFIPLEANKSIVMTMYGLLADDNNTEQEFLNLMRVIPGLGDSLVRMAVFSLFPDIERKEYRSVTGMQKPTTREYRRGGTGTGGTAAPRPGQPVVPVDEGGWNRLTGDVLREVIGNNSTEFENNQMNLLKTAEGLEQVTRQPIVTQGESTEAQPQPQPETQPDKTSTTNVFEGMQNQKPKQAPDALFD